MGSEKAKVFDVVKKAILEVIPDLDPGVIAIEKSLKDLGANSIDRMEVVTRSLEELQLSIPLMSFAKVSNIQGLVDVLDHHSQMA